MKSLFISLLFIASFCSVKANEIADTTKKVLLAEAKKSAEPLYIVKESNVIFPDILKGNEEESIKYIETFAKNRRDYLIRTYNKGKKILPKAVKILKKHNIPEEFKVLLPLESGYNAKAVSSAGAVGYWQIMDFVAKEYGLKYVPQISPEEKKKMMKANPKAADSILAAMKKLPDDRTHFVKSTNMAARYLKDRYKNLGDNWLLIVASYNCGIGNVWNAMQKSGKSNPSFWDVKNYLPAETRAYVMNFIALNVIFHNYENFAKNNLKFYPEKIRVDNFEEITQTDANDY